MRVAIVADAGFPQKKITEMLDTCPWEDVQWIVKDSDKTAIAALEASGLEYTKEPLDPYWHRVVYPLGPPVLITHKETKLEDGTIHRTPLKKPREKMPEKVTVYDMRSQGREFVFLNTCDHVLVFRLASSDANKHWVGRPSPFAKISVIEHGRSK